MVRNHGCGIADGREVVDAVPFLEQPDIVHQRVELLVAQGQIEGAHARRKNVPLAHAAERCALPVARFRWTSSNDSAAGVTPWMRAAWPIVSGRCSFSFCWTSADRPLTLR